MGSIFVTTENISKRDAHDDFVAHKYEVIYTTLHTVVKSVVNTDQMSPGEKYSYLKRNIAPVWGLIASGQLGKKM